MIGSGDWAHGGEDGDLFALGDWIDPDTPATIADFTAQEDQITVVFDPQVTPDPLLSIEPSEDHEAANWILLDGVRLAEVLDTPGLIARDVMLMPAQQFALS